jgi:hypothetical protein
VCLLFQQPAPDQNSMTGKRFCCNLNEPSVIEFNPAKGVVQWYFASKIIRHVQSHKKPNQKQLKYIAHLLFNTRMIFCMTCMCMFITVGYFC